MNKLDNFPCKCGHAIKDHTWSDRHVNSCHADMSAHSWCPCVTFIADNLKYLEWRYDGNTTR
jgi:hypothetical protein